MQEAEFFMQQLQRRLSSVPTSSEVSVLLYRIRGYKWLASFSEGNILTFNYVLSSSSSPTPSSMLVSSIDSSSSIEPSE